MYPRSGTRTPPRSTRTPESCGNWTWGYCPSGQLRWLCVAGQRARTLQFCAALQEARRDVEGPYGLRLLTVLWASSPSSRRCAEAPRARLPPGVSSLPETRWLLGAAAAAQRVASGSARPAAPVALGRGRRQRVEQAQVRVAYIAKTVYGGSDRGSAVRRRAKLHWTVLN